jgi:hypothetical protein
MADVPLTLASQTIRVPQLPASNSNGSQGLNLSSSLTNSLSHQTTTSLHFTSLHSTALHSLIVPLITHRHRLHRKHRSFVAAPIVVCAAIGVDHTENIAFQPVHWRMLEICCLAQVMFTESLVSNGSTCYNMFV